jgi:hypothetical protein
MSKIARIEIRNLKKIPFAELDLQGKSVIVTGSNDKGKSTLIRTIIDRIRGERPEMIVTQDENDGKSFMVLTTGERFEWEYDVKGKDKLTLFTAKNHRINVTKEIAAEYFPPAFDIDVFMKAEPKKQGIMLQKLVGLDFTAVDVEYKSAYEARTLANAEANRETIRLQGMNRNIEFVAPVKTDLLIVEKDLIREKLNNQYRENKKANDTMRTAWDAENVTAREDIDKFNREQDDKVERIKKANTCLQILRELGYEGREVELFTAEILKSIKEKKIYSPLPNPLYITPEVPDDSEIKAIDQKIADAATTNQRAQDWINLQEQEEKVKVANQTAQEADDRVKAAEQAKKDLINTAKLPDGITFATDGSITVDGFPLNDAQISSSKKYITALRLGSLNLGEVESMYFDASYLDRANYEAVQKWADENKLQLLVEKASWEEQEMRYEIVE